MDIPRRKNRQHSDKLTAELLFFCLWLTRCGEVELGCFESYGLENYGQHSPSSYRRYAKELEKCGAIPRMKLRGNNTDGNNRRRFISDPPVEDFAPEVRFDGEDDHLRRLARLVCMAASVLVPDGTQRPGFLWESGRINRDPALSGRYMPRRSTWQYRRRG